MAYYGYLRVSTETQAEKGGGLETQRQNIDAYCKRNGITIDRYYTDAGISGAIADDADADAISKRRALIDMLAALKDGDNIITMNTSRLWRSTNAGVIIRRELVKKHANVISIENPRYSLYDRNPNDRFMDGMMELMDEWERLTIALKLAKGRTAKANTGNKPAGVCPYGYEYSADRKTIEVNTAEAQTVRRIYTLAQTGASLQAISDALTADGITTRRGKPFSRGTLSEMLTNRFYLGELQHAGETIQGNHKPLISRVQYGKVQAQLARRRRSK